MFLYCGVIKLNIEDEDVRYGHIIHLMMLI